MTTAAVLLQQLLPTNTSLHFERAVKFTNDASGKDRLLRLFVFAGRLVMLGLKRRGMPQAAARIKAIDTAFNNTRRVLRLGKLGNAVKQWRDCRTKFPWWKSSELALFFVVELFKITVGNVYLVCDHLRWLGEIGAAKSIDWKKWGDWSTWCWLYGVIGSLAMDALQLRASREREQQLLQDLKAVTTTWRKQHPHRQLDQRSPEQQRQSDAEEVEEEEERRETRRREVERSLEQLREARKLILWDVAKNLWDAPLAVFGSFKLEGAPEGSLELCGTISSLINIYLSWRAMFPPPPPSTP